MSDLKNKKEVSMSEAINSAFKELEKLTPQEFKEKLQEFSDRNGVGAVENLYHVTKNW